MPADIATQQPTPTPIAAAPLEATAPPTPMAISESAEKALPPSDTTSAVGINTSNLLADFGNQPDVLSDESISRHQSAAVEVGVKLVADTSKEVELTGNPREDFLRDHYRFMAENDRPFKLRRIGGAELDLFGLYKAVLERGGLQTVVMTRAFKMVAKALNLPKTCTSAAFILRVEYEKLLFAYEQKHVWGRRVTIPVPQQQPAPRRASTYGLRYGERERDRGHSQEQPPPSVSMVLVEPEPAAPAAIHPLQKPSARPRRAAALAASNAVAAAVSDDPYSFPVFPRRGRLTGLDEASLTPHEEALVDDELLNDNAPHGLYQPGQPGERERVVSALWSPIQDDVAWALGTLNALSFDLRNLFIAKEFPGVLDALQEILARHLQDIRQRRTSGLPAGQEEMNAYSHSPHIIAMPAVDIQEAGGGAVMNGMGLPSHGQTVSTPSLQKYGGLFNLADPVAIDREQCAVVVGNVLRNMSFCEQNALLIAGNASLLQLSSIMIETAEVTANLRDSLMDMWINASPYMDASSGRAANAVLGTCIKLLDPFREGAELSRFTNCGEVLARLAACPERNEEAIVTHFDDVLPRLVDMLGGRNRRYVNAGLAALCNLSAFDWPARDRIARTPRALDRLVGMLADGELAPRAGLTLLNLAESPSNRSVMLGFETRLVEVGLRPTPAADTVAQILFELSSD